jgi:hypothetical protein
VTNQRKGSLLTAAEAQSVQKPRERNIGSRTALLQVRTRSLILCMKIRLTKQLAFTGNHRSTMVRLAALYVPCFRSLFPHLPPTSTSFQTTVLVIGAGFSRQFCRKTL